MLAHRFKLPDHLCFGAFYQRTGKHGLKSVHLVPRTGRPKPLCGRLVLPYQRVFPRPGQKICPQCLREYRAPKEPPPLKPKDKWIQDMLDTVVLPRGFSRDD